MPYSASQNAQEREIIRRKLSLDAAETIILYTGRINEHKGLHWLVSAVRQLLPHYPGVKLLIVGPTTQSDQAYAQSLQEKVVQTGLSNSIRFVGRVANVYEYLQAADIFAIPTCREGFSGAILEAMSSKLPVVASDIPEIALSQIQNGTEGILVPVGDTEQLAQALETLIRNAELRSRLGNAARERVEREFTFQVIGSRYLRLYKSLLAERKFNEVSTEKDS